MKASVLKTEKRQESRIEALLKIQTNGEKNDYPQRVIEILDSSVTGSGCVRVYQKFIQGRGFNVEEFFRAIINGKGQTPDYLLTQVSDDFARLGGLTLHINYNALYEAVEIQHIPFETVRLEKLDDKYICNRVAIHPDWGKRNLKIRKFNHEDIDFIHFYNPDPKQIALEVEEAGGWDKYKGQVFYFSNRGDKVYSLPIFDSELTDMNTEEGLSNIKNRNTRNNFLPSGMVVDYGAESEGGKDEDAAKKELTEFQGDMKVGKLMYVKVLNKDETPTFVPFKSNNYDKDFTETEKSCKDNIGRVFNQPPILRAEDVGANFGSDLMENAYSFYNSITEGERNDIESVFRSIFEHWYDQSINPDQDYSIIPREYNVKKTLAERLGDNTDKVFEIINSTEYSDPKKKNILSILFGMSDDDITLLIQK